MINGVDAHSDFGKPMVLEVHDSHHSPQKAGMCTIVVWGCYKSET